MAMEELRDYLETLTSKLARQPAQLRAAIRSFPEADWHRPIEPGGWDPHQVLAHLTAAQQLALMPRLMRILDEDNPDLPDWDQDQWMEASYDRVADPQAMVSDMESGVRQILSRLESLDLQDWNRSGRHPLRGSRTFLWWLEYLTNHNDEHIQELSRASA